MDFLTWGEREGEMVGTTYTRELPLLDKSEWVMCL